MNVDSAIAAKLSHARHLSRSEIKMRNSVATALLLFSLLDALLSSLLDALLSGLLDSCVGLAVGFVYI